MIRLHLGLAVVPRRQHHDEASPGRENGVGEERVGSPSDARNSVQARPGIRRDDPPKAVPHQRYGFLGEIHVSGHGKRGHRYASGVVGQLALGA
ncbi:hypothetical protein SCATT_32430 [Streptantibioticus cattleyicolor NRRL 8057 = DSM 46488]|uniref:Uncharacterized protein n=1 Tax=Streptantibioticus cattleyicolor (strain ATCC 35852 / DSM 46488 / JCM 4925 / NBRC 14057 / NRRL 8057) TaxID=1003195 RepID=G8X2M2_STREN|nr:hypothetical protein SCATT_32430 [Streptantibioticus cattleyicolor NRRL 8057 = DSM 46488]